MPRDLDSPESQFPPPVLASVACTVTEAVAVRSLALVPDENPEPDCHAHLEPTVPEPVTAPYGVLSVTGEVGADIGPEVGNAAVGTVIVEPVIPLSEPTVILRSSM